MMVPRFARRTDGVCPSALLHGTSRKVFQKHNIKSEAEIRIRITGQQNLSDTIILIRPFTHLLMQAYCQFGDKYIQTQRPGGYDANLQGRNNNL
jgi:hypothetical protein